MIAFHEEEATRQRQTEAGAMGVAGAALDHIPLPSSSPPSNVDSPIRWQHLPS